MTTYGPSYGGVYLAVGDPALAAWVESTLSLSDLYDFLRATTGGRLAALGYPWLPRDFKPKLNVLYWPCWASRWAQGHFLVTDEQLAKIRPLAYTGGSLTPLPFILGDGVNSVTATLYMLPPRPLTPPAPNANLLYLLTLVDARFFWWDQAATVTVTPDTTTWAQLFAALAIALNVSLTADTVPAAYLKPTAAFGTAYEWLPPQLDAAARAVGMRVVVNFNGTVEVVSATHAQTLFSANLTLNPITAGGLIDLTNDATSDLASVLPLQVTVVDANQVATPVTLASLALGQYSGANVYAGSPVLRTLLAGAGSQIAALATQIATDWYGWRQQRPDVLYEGVCPWTPTGIEDRIEWQHRDDGIFTRVQRPPWNERLDYGMGGGGPGPGGPTIQYATLSGSMSIALDPTADYLELTLGVSGATLTNLTGGTPDRPILLKLLGTGVMQFGAGFLTSPTNLIAHGGDSFVLRYDAGWFVGPPNNRVAADPTDQTPDFLMQKIQAGDNIATSLTIGTSRKVRIDATGIGNVNITNITNITDITNKLYFNVFDQTLNYYYNGVWYSYCPCATYPVPSGSSGSSGSAGPASILTLCCPDHPIPQSPPLVGTINCASCPAIDGWSFPMPYVGNSGGVQQWYSGLIDFPGGGGHTQSFLLSCQLDGTWKVQTVTTYCYGFNHAPDSFDCSVPVWYFTTTVTDVLDCVTCTLGANVILTIEAA